MAFVHISWAYNCLLHYLHYKRLGAKSFFLYFLIMFVTIENLGISLLTMWHYFLSFTRHMQKVRVLNFLFYKENIVLKKMKLKVHYMLLIFPRSRLPGHTRIKPSHKFFHSRHLLRPLIDLLFLRAMRPVQ